MAREYQKEVEMEEKTIEPEEKEAEQPLSEAPEAETKSVQELAEHVKTCLIEDKDCEALGTKLHETAEALGLEVDDLVREIAGLISA